MNKWNNKNWMEILKYILNNEIFLIQKKNKNLWTKKYNFLILLAKLIIINKFFNFLFIYYYFYTL